MSELIKAVNRLQHVKLPDSDQKYVSLGHVLELIRRHEPARESMPTVGGGDNSEINWGEVVCRHLRPDDKAGTVMRVINALRPHLRIPSPLPIRAEVERITKLEADRIARVLFEADEIVLSKKVHRIAYAEPTDTGIPAPALIAAGETAGLADRVRELEEALRFYADEHHYWEELKDSIFRTTAINEDRGKRARQALGVQPLMEGDL